MKQRSSQSITNTLYSLFFSEYLLETIFCSCSFNCRSVFKKLDTIPSIEVTSYITNNQNNHVQNELVSVCKSAHRQQGAVLEVVGPCDAKIRHSLKVAYNAVKLIRGKAKISHVLIVTYNAVKLIRGN